MKKYFFTALGILFGTLFSSGLASAADVGFTSSGNPTQYNGPSGQKANGRGTTGRFGSIQQVGMEIIRFIEVILVPLIMSLALLAFLWGILHYIRNGGDPAEREQSRQFMIWGVIGLAVMASVWGLVRILTNTLGVPMGIPSLDTIK